MDDWNDATFQEREARIAAGEVRCDINCGARENPHTVEEFIAAWKHWKSHRNMYGCSHGQ